MCCLVEWAHQLVEYPVNGGGDDVARPAKRLYDADYSIADGAACNHDGADEDADGNAELLDFAEGDMRKLMQQQLTANG